MTLFQWIERFFQKRQVATILNLLRANDQLHAQFDLESTTIYRVPFPLEPGIEINPRSREHAPINFRRGLLDMLGLGARAYIIDSAPGALFGKANGVILFRGIFDFDEPQIIVTQQPIEINSSPFDYFNPGFLGNLAVYGSNNIQAQMASPTIYQSLPPLTGPFPVDDLPNPTGATPAPTPTPSTPGSGSGTTPPVNLFYGLCFQEPRPSHQALYIGPFKIRDSFVDTDPLWTQTQNMAAAFAARGYISKTGLAGDHDPAKQGDAASFELMMAGLEADLNANQTFCNSPNDQLVILVAAHGYGEPYNPTNDVAMHYKPKDAEEWVNYHQLFNRLNAITKISNFPGKVYILFYSCRSGRAFEGGVLPGDLKGMHILTAAASSDVLAGSNGFSGWITDALGRYGSTSWDDFVKRVKHSARGDSYGPPRNGNAKGCRAQIQLTSVIYNGDNIGGNWIYDLRLDGKVLDANGNEKYTVPGSATNVAEHALAWTATDTQNLALYDRIWEACATTNQVTMNFYIKATQTDGVDDTGQINKQIQFICNGGNSTPTIPLDVTEIGGTAHMLFNFTITTTCV